MKVCVGASRVLAEKSQSRSFDSILTTNSVHVTHLLHFCLHSLDMTQYVYANSHQPYGQLVVVK